MGFSPSMPALHVSADRTGEELAPGCGLVVAGYYHHHLPAVAPPGCAQPTCAPCPFQTPLLTARTCAANDGSQRLCSPRQSVVQGLAPALANLGSAGRLLDVRRRASAVVKVRRPYHQPLIDFLIAPAFFDLGLSPKVSVSLLALHPPV